MVVGPSDLIGVEPANERPPTATASSRKTAVLIGSGPLRRYSTNFMLTYTEERLCTEVGKDCRGRVRVGIRVRVRED